MPRVTNWSAPVSTAVAYKRAGMRRKWLARKKIEIAERRHHFGLVCLSNNFPFYGSIREITAKFIEYMTELRQEPYYISHYTAVYDLKAIFGDEYLKIYRKYAKLDVFDYPIDVIRAIEAMLEESQSPEPDKDEL